MKNFNFNGRDIVECSLLNKKKVIIEKCIGHFKVFVDGVYRITVLSDTQDWNDLVTMSRIA